MSKRKLEENNNNSVNKKQKIDTVEKIELDNKSKVYNWNSAFPTVFDWGEWFPQAKTVVEVSLIRSSSIIRSETNWHLNLNNPDWVSAQRNRLKKLRMKSYHLDYVFDELRQYYVNLIDGPIFPSLVDGVYLADNIITELQQQIIFACSTDILERKGNTNFRSEIQDLALLKRGPFLDLICPSLCCYNEDTSKKYAKPVQIHHIVKHSALFKPLVYDGPQLKVEDSYDEYYSEDDDEENQTFYDHNYWWLPSEFNIDDVGRVTIESYINNLHPLHYAAVYPCVAQIFEAFVPLFNKALFDVINPQPNRIPHGQHKKDFDPVMPKIRDSATVVDLRGQHVQVITRMTRIRLAAEEEYISPWQVDGMPEERIIATGVYCFHSDEIPSMRISFREPFEKPFGKPKPSDTFGLALGDSFIRQRGLVTLQPGRCLVYPNMWQHQLQVKNTSAAPGSMSLLFFHLVDPASSVTSTQNVLPQQASWLISPTVFFDPGVADGVPPEIWRLIFKDDYNYRFTYPEAFARRIAALNERKVLNKMISKEWEDRTNGSRSDW